ncbi:hypothetical protein CEP54_014104 [Fusarium duplospermum]|uniref:RING-type domain-containing protein n=1 Tax=Fusarium duplospermum TaxID=1325734 RepID=A0A428NYU7_9HYPO|nr:hypothetical protein CEP54_014104 [Fusarium duplospermum]
MTTEVKHADIHPTSNWARGLNQAFTAQYLCLEYNNIPTTSVQRALERSGYDLEKSYFDLGHDVDCYDVDNPPFKIAPQTMSPKEKDELREHLIDISIDEGDKLRVRAMLGRLARRRQRRLRSRIPVLRDCECCYIKTSQLDMVHCQAQENHWFCKKCFSGHAWEVVGKLRYEIPCMSTDGCNAGFSHQERKRGLNSDVLKALDKQEARAAILGIEGLVHCSFCDFVGFFQPHEAVEELHCPECDNVSQLGRREDTWRAQTNQGVEDADLRRQEQRRIEEAQSDAVIRRCKGCKVSFMKLDGCNKMTCPSESCNIIQCYICSEVCDYSHFDFSDDRSEPDKCPLYDDTEARHQREIDLAEQSVRKETQGYQAPRRL